MAVQNLIISLSWQGVGRFVGSEHVIDLKHALCSHSQFVTPSLGGWVTPESQVLFVGPQRQVFPS